MAFACVMGWALIRFAPGAYFQQVACVKLSADQELVPLVGIDMAAVYVSVMALM